MTPADWLELILLGGIAGAAGQSARAIVGLKKLNDEVSANGGTGGLDPSRLLVSLLIGFVAGVLGAITLNPDIKSLAVLDAKSVMAFAVIGYSATDFIEGIISRYMPSGGGASGATQSATPPAPQPAPLYEG